MFHSINFDFDLPQLCFDLSFYQLLWKQNSYDWPDQLEAAAQCDLTFSPSTLIVSSV